MTSASTRIALIAAMLAVGLPSGVLAQSAGAGSPGTGSSSAPASGDIPTASTPPPSAGAPTGKSVIGAETPVEKQEDQKQKQETTICKGC